MGGGVWGVGSVVGACSAPPLGRPAPQPQLFALGGRGGEEGARGGESGGRGGAACKEDQGREREHSCRAADPSLHRGPPFRCGPAGR